MATRWAAWLCLCFPIAVGSDSLTENLLLRPLPDGRTLTHLNFANEYEYDANATLTHFEMLPKGLIQLVQHFHVSELHLTFTQGRWFSHRWGHSPAPAPNGAELWAWFDKSVQRAAQSLVPISHRSSWPDACALIPRACETQKTRLAHARRD